MTNIWKMGAIVVFRLLVLDSLKYSSKAKSPINRYAKAVISRNLTTSRHNHLFICLFYFYVIFFIFYLFIYFCFYVFFFFFYLFKNFYFIFHIFSENRHYRLICIEIATAVIGWPE